MRELTKLVNNASRSISKRKEQASVDVAVEAATATRAAVAAS